jgi:predicted dithiol-disulfide oxidoreductase (DUF899 family)
LLRRAVAQAIERHVACISRVRFAGESLEYRAARARLLASEIELRRSMEAVAAARRELPPGGPTSTGYVYE